MEILPIMDKVYIAGALNSDACGYIQNLSRMSKFANKIMRLGFAVFSPGNDFIQGVVSGKLQYDDYFNNSQELLRASDAMFVVPGSEKSEGVARERAVSEQLNIPVFETIDDLVEFGLRPKILAIVGESGTGKTTIADYIEDVYNIPMIRSHTDRPKRYLEEDSHTFHSPVEFNLFKREDMIAWTQWGDVRYCCLKQDVEPDNTYVIDERGILMMTNLYKNDYKVFKLRIKRDLRSRVKDVGTRRVERDAGNFWLPEHYYDAVLENNGSLEDLYEDIDKVFTTFFL